MKCQDYNNENSFNRNKNICDSGGKEWEGWVEDANLSSFLL